MTMTTAAEYRQQVALQMREDTLQESIEALARRYGWLTYHTHDSRRSNPGFPDLVLLRGPRLMFAELKKQKGKVTPDQRTWLTALGELCDSIGFAVCPGDHTPADAPACVACAADAHRPRAVEVHLWRPSDWLDDTILNALR